MIRIRSREGMHGTRYQVIVHQADGRPLTRTFRRLTEARAWASSEEKRLREREVTKV